MMRRKTFLTALGVALGCAAWGATAAAKGHPFCATLTLLERGGTENTQPVRCACDGDVRLHVSVSQQIGPVTVTGKVGGSPGGGSGGGGDGGNAGDVCFLLTVIRPNVFSAHTPGPDLVEPIEATETVIVRECDHSGCHGGLWALIVGKGHAECKVKSMRDHGVSTYRVIGSCVVGDPNGGAAATPGGAVTRGPGKKGPTTGGGGAGPMTPGGDQ